MANTGPHSGGSQIFINMSDNLVLDWWVHPETKRHPVFGVIVEGFEAVIAIEQARKVDGMPVAPIKILSCCMAMEDADAKQKREEEKLKTDAEKKEEPKKKEEESAVNGPDAPLPFL